MSLDLESDIHSPTGSSMKKPFIQRAVTLKQLMDTDFAAFLSGTSRFRELAKLNGARFAEGVFARLVAGRIEASSLFGPSMEAAQQATSLLNGFSKARSITFPSEPLPQPMPLAEISTLP